MNMENILSELEEKKELSIVESFTIAKNTSTLLRKEEVKARRIIIYILDMWEKIPKETHEIWTDLIESAGFYPYLERNKENFVFNNLAGEIRKCSHYSSNLKNKYFHEEQKYLKELLFSNKNLIVSAPTSFGKSLLIEEMVASNKYANIVIIQPTLALLDETRKKLKKYKDDYKIIVRTSQEFSLEKGNLFLLTAERVMEYKNLPNINFFVIDEFYKLSAKRDDERSDVLNNAFYRLLKQERIPQFYLLGPNIDGISEGFAKKYNALFYKTNYSLIENKTIDIYSEHKDKFDKPRKFKVFKEKILFEKLYELRDEQTIIYCSSPNRVRYLAKEFTNFLSTKKNMEIEELPLVEWIKKFVNPNWNLVEFLKYGIGINDGALQKHINTSMIDYFNEKKLNYIFCTSTIIEGVNTSAKNVIFYDKTKGENDVDYFDYSNIKGRSGRMMEHYIGKIYNFNPEPEKNKNEMIIDIPFFEQNPVKKEIINGMDEKEIKEITKESNEYKELMEIPYEERKLFQKNGVLIDGQKRILDVLKLDILNKKKRELIQWTTYPNIHQLDYALGLCWKFLIKRGNVEKINFSEYEWNLLIENGYIYKDGLKTEKFDDTKKADFVKMIPYSEHKLKEIFTKIYNKKGETTSPMTKKRLVKLTNDYGFNRDINDLIKSNFNYFETQEKYKKLTKQEIINEAIKEAFHVLRHWFQYKVPKWLNVMNELQKYVCEKNNISAGNYTIYATQIENDFIRNNLTILSEYGIPVSAIKKLEKKIDSSISEDEVILKAKDIILYDNSFLEYEKIKILDL